MTHHICIHDDYIIFDNEVIPVGKTAIEEKVSAALTEVLESIVHKISDGDIVLCGEGDAQRMLGRKLEDRLGRAVTYE